MAPLRYTDDGDVDGLGRVAAQEDATQVGGCQSCESSNARCFRKAQVDKIHLGAGGLRHRDAHGGTTADGYESDAREA